jgi:UDP-N-acetylglucosamine 1-carboxyvinyltransferase
MGTENAVLAAVGARGVTVISNAASEPHVQGLCRMLQSMGAGIEGVGSNVLRVRGREGENRLLGGATHTLLPDHIEVGSFIGLAAVTGGGVRIEGAAPANLRMIRLVFERLGVRVEVQGEDLWIPAGRSCRSSPSSTDRSPA